MAGLFDGLKNALGLGGDSTTTLAPAMNSGLAPNKPANMRNLMSAANKPKNSTMAALAPASAAEAEAAPTNSMAGGRRKKNRMKKYKMKRAAASRKNRRAASRKNRRATRKNRK